VEYESNEQAWDAFLQGDLDGLITWISDIPEGAEPYLFALIPGLSEEAYTYARGFIWSLPAGENTNTELASSFLEHMTEPQFLLEWAPISGYLPVRPSSIAGWNEPEQTVLVKILSSAQLTPAENIISSLKSEYILAIQGILSGTSSPDDSAQKIIDSLYEEPAQ